MPLALGIAGVSALLSLMLLRTSLSASGTFVRYSFIVTLLLLMAAVGSPSVRNTTRWGMTALGRGAK